MDIKSKIKELEQEALRIMTEAKEKADAMIETSADGAEGVYDDAALLMAQAEAQVFELSEEAKLLANQWLDALGDRLKDTKSFYARNKLWLGIAGAVVVVIVIGLIVLV